MTYTTQCLAFLAMAISCGRAMTAEKYDLLIRGGRVLDGTGSPWYVADVAVRDGHIARVGRIEDGSAPRTLEARGLVVAPGFIDMMGQTATPLLEDPQSAMNLLTQGITTINAGEGDSAAPLAAPASHSNGWETMAEYLQLLDIRGLPVNVVQTVGHTQVRQLVLGDVDRKPTDREMNQMKDLVRESMEAGAIGLSTALIYPPAVYATTDEIAQLAAVVGQYGGRYYTHLRNEGDQLLEAMDEALAIGRQARVPVHIFHLKAAGRDNWGKTELSIARIHAARAAGQEVTADIYPYVNNGLGLESLVHPRHFAAGRARFIERLKEPRFRAEVRAEMEGEGGWENWYRHVGRDWNKVVLGRIEDASYAQLAGQSIAAIAKAKHEDPWDTFFRLLPGGAFALPESMSEANKIQLLRQPFVSFCTDVGPLGGSKIASHPRACGSFPRLFSRYVRDLGVLSLERAVAQASAAAANDIMAYDRGRIVEGAAADIVVFDAETLEDRATLREPHLRSVGMKYVVVAGQLVLDDGKYTGARPGRVLRGPGYRTDRAPPALRTGKEDARTASFDRMISAFMERHHVPGAAIAVTDHGRLVHARGYGYADLAARTPVAPTSIFRIASLSKPITAVAVLQLIEQGKLSFDSRVFEILPAGPPGSKGTPPDKRLSEITVRHLLEHRGGWDRDQSFDAMFQSIRFAKALGVKPPARPEDIIRCMSEQPLDFTPGERYAYSNYGYCLLGRVIEAVTHEEYEAYVRRRVLVPLGMHAMRLAKTRLPGRCDGEVRYYDPGKGESVFVEDLQASVPQPYGAWCVEAMDAHGGWLASAVDLARFACAFDDPGKCPLLGEAMIREMFARPQALAGHEPGGKPKPVYYSCGWNNRVLDGGAINRWHTGSLPGTATILVRRHDLRNWVVLLNSRVSALERHLGQAIDPLVHQAADEVSAWPDFDLFQEFSMKGTSSADGTQASNLP